MESKQWSASNDPGFLQLMLTASLQVPFQTKLEILEHILQGCRDLGLKESLRMLAHLTKRSR